VAFFRSLGGTIGVAALGAVLAARVKSGLSGGITDLLTAGTIRPDDPDLVTLASGKVPNLTDLTNPVVRTLVQDVYSSGVAELFFIGLPIAIIAAVSIVLLKEIPLGKKSGIEQMMEEVMVESSMTNDEEVIEEARAGAGGHA
jgi:hypothetical protein